ncbi:MAG: hypothetical protein JWO42_1983 [Chloroflexi bacterium]|nr:hypothetical protein [Chloroflexota bacterium]
MCTRYTNGPARDFGTGAFVYACALGEAATIAPTAFAGQTFEPKRLIQLVGTPDGI